MQSKRQRNLVLILGALLLVVVGVLLLRSDETGSGSGSAAQRGTAGDGAHTPLLDEKGKPVVPWYRRSEGASARGPAAGSLRLEGQVVDAQEIPVAGAMVVLSAYPPRMLTSSEDGGFVFEGLPPGSYRVSARKGDLVSAAVERELTDASAPVILRMAVGGRVYIEVVTQGSGAPVAGAEVSTDHGHQEVTDAQGLALLRGARGTLRLWVRAPKFASLNTMVTVPDAPGSEEKIRVTMIEGAPLAGRVVDEKGQPVANARVYSQNPLELYEQAHGADAVISDADGKFGFEVVPAGTYEFVAEHPDYGPGTSGPLKTDGKTSPQVQIVMSTGALITGSVVDSAGAPVPNASVRVQVEIPSDKMRSGDGGESRTGEDGTFEVRGLARKVMMVQAASADATSEPARVDLASGDARNLVLKLGGNSFIRGTVVDANGQPIPDVKVVAMPEGNEPGGLHGFAESTTDGAGAFDLKPLARGPYQVGVEKGPGELRGGVSAQTGANNVRIVLKADGAVTGQVQLASGGAPGSFSVELNVPPGKLFSEGQGSFLVSDVAEGTYDVVIRGAQFSETVVRDVKVLAGQKTDMGVIRVQGGRTLSGRVTDASGQPVAGAQVVVGREIFGDGGALVARAMGRAAEESLGLRSARTDARGNFQITGAPGTEMVIAAEHEGGRSAPIEVPAGNDNRSFDLKLQTQGAVTGRVTAGGRPAAGIRVMATHEGSTRQFANVVTGPDGMFRFERLSQGPTTITAVESGLQASNVTSKRVNVTATPGKPIELELERGNVTLLLEVKGAVYSEVYVFSGNVSASTAQDIQQAMLSHEGGRRVGDATQTAPALISGLLPGPVSICVVPLDGDPRRDQQFARRYRESGERVPAVCQPFEVQASPERQTMTMQVRGTRI